MKDRIYVCHTFYHVYVTMLKELALVSEEQGKATLVLSKMSNDFGPMKERAEKCGLFEEVVWFDEKRDDFFPELSKYRQDKGNIFFNMLSRIRFTKKYAALEEAYIPLNFKEYKDIYVFCDADPIGVYLNQKGIYYHSVEDGLDTLIKCDEAHFDNRGHFELKAFFSKKLNLIVIANGYGKYCLDMEVNNIAGIEIPCPYYKEVSRKALTERLTKEDKERILSVFIDDETHIRLKEVLSHDGGVLILTEPLCDLETRERIFRDIIAMFEGEGTIVLKPHPRDVLDYHAKFSEYPIVDGFVPMEMLNFLETRFEKVVSVFTELSAVEFAKEKVALGFDFMDKYEDPKIHRYAQGIADAKKH